MNDSATGDFVSSAWGEWQSQTSRYDKAMRYFSGRVFDERSTTDPEAPYKYPLKINLGKTMCLSQAAALWGQWDEHLVGLRCDPDKEEVEAARKRAELALDIVKSTWSYSNLEQGLYEGAIGLQVYGGFFLRAWLDMQAPWGVRVDQMPAYQVMPRYHPIDKNRLLEVYIVVPVDRNEASLAYDIPVKSLPENTLYLEHWTESFYETTVGEHRLAAYSGINPWGIVPVVYVPRLRYDGFYGLPMIEDLYGLQDEINLRLADMGDRINETSHPTYTVTNYRGDVERELPIGRKQLLDLGHSIPGQDPPRIDVIHSEPEPPSTFDFMEMLMELTRYSSFTSPVAFGVDEGSQRSSATLEIRLWPMLMQAKASRIYLKTALRDLNRKILKMVAQRNESVNDTVVRQEVVPDFAPLIPRDIANIIQEIANRASHDLISPEEAVAMTGVRKGSEGDEVGRIKEWLEYRLKTEAKYTTKINGPGNPDSGTSGPALQQHGGSMPPKASAG